MIKGSGGGLYWYSVTGEWRHYAIGLVVYCDADDCDASIRVEGLEHNGGEVEAVYLPRPEGDDWVLGNDDFCPKHAHNAKDDAE